MRAMSIVLERIGGLFFAFRHGARGGLKRIEISGRNRG